MNFGQVMASIGSYNTTTGVWTISSLSSGGQAVLTIVATATQAGTIINTAAVTASDQNDPDINNNRSTVTITVQQVTNIEQEIRDLIARITTLVASGELTRVQGRILTTLLEIASDLHKQGGDVNAINVLKGDQLVVRLLIRTRPISRETGQNLINALQKIINDLQASALKTNPGQGNHQKNIEQSVQKNIDNITLNNYPNPFSTATVISFKLVKESRVQLIIYDESGRRLIHLLDQVMTPGTHNITWDAMNLAPGIYTVQLKSAGVVKTHRMVHVK